jgi:hypothetical protein
MAAVATGSRIRLLLRRDPKLKKILLGDDTVNLPEFTVRAIHVMYTAVFEILYTVHTHEYMRSIYIDDWRRRIRFMLTPAAINIVDDLLPIAAYADVFMELHTLFSAQPAQPAQPAAAPAAAPAAQPAAAPAAAPAAQPDAVSWTGAHSIMDQWIRDGVLCYIDNDTLNEMKVEYRDRKTVLRNKEKAIHEFPSKVVNAEDDELSLRLIGDDVRGVLQAASGLVDASHPLARVCEKALRGLNASNTGNVSDTGNASDTSLINQVRMVLFGWPR